MFFYHVIGRYILTKGCAEDEVGSTGDNEQGDGTLKGRPVRSSGVYNLGIEGP
jgi:hypothetical protein